MKLRLPTITIATAAAAYMPIASANWNGKTTTAFVSVNPRKRVLQPSTYNNNGNNNNNNMSTLTTAPLRTHSSLSVSAMSTTVNDLSNLPAHMPPLGEDGIYELNSQEEHAGK